MSDKIGRHRGGNGWRDAPADGAGDGGSIVVVIWLVRVLEREKSELQPLDLEEGERSREREREREVDACVLPLACCRCINLLQARRAAAGELGARGQLGVASGGSARGGRRNRLSIVFWAGPIGI